MDVGFGRLVDFGFNEPNLNASWQAAPNLVHKMEASFKVVVDLRSINTSTVSEAWSMPYLESELADFAEMKCPAALDLCNAYTQVPLDRYHTMHAASYLRR